MDRLLIENGLNALANSHYQYPGAWFMGHNGAAILAGAFLLEEQQLSTAIKTAIRNEVQRLWQSDEKLQAPLDSTTDLADLNPLLRQLEESLSHLSADGHGVIFGVLALKALKQFPELATAAIISGICNVLKDSMQDDPKRYYGFDNYGDPSINYSSIKKFKTVTDVALYSLYQHGEVFSDRLIDEKFYFFAGDQLHLVTHAHALLDLENLGYSDLASTGLEALRKQFFLTANRKIPVDSHAYTAKQLHSPQAINFWQRNKTDAHHLKLAYSSLSLLNLVEPAEHRNILTQLSKYWELLS